MKSKTVFAVLVFMLLSATASVSWAEGGFGEVLISSADTVENKNVRIELSLSSAPEGLSGFEILVSSENASIVETLSASPQTGPGCQKKQSIVYLYHSLLVNQTQLLVLTLNMN